MIQRAKAFAKRHWPALRLRTILFSVLLFVAALPVLSAVFLRVYENTLVRQTEAELIAQGAALTAAAEAIWPGGAAVATSVPLQPGDYRPEALSIDLSATPVLAERPPADPASGPADAPSRAAAARLAPVLRATSRTTLASIVLTDAAGRVLIGPEAGRSYAALPELRSALAGAPLTTLRRNAAYRPHYAFEWLSRAGALRIHYARPVIRDGRVLGVLLLSRSPRALFRGVYEDRYKILLGVGVISAALVVMSGLVSRGVTRPVEALSAASRRVASGQGAVPETPRTAAIEIRALYEDFRTMAQAIERRSRYLRDFAAAVSHEFKTPLAGIRGAVELLEDHGESMTATERRRFLGVITDGADRLSQLVTRLLDLARADMARPEAGVAVDIADAVQRVADARRAAGFEVVLALPERLPGSSAPAGALEAVLTTLLDNSRQAGARRVVIEARAMTGAVRLRVQDDGPGVSPGDRARLFEPFFTTRREAGGTGLGLPIARSLLASSDGTLALAPSAAGACFEITLPTPAAAGHG